MIEGHISRAFDGALAALHMRVIEMGGLVLEQVREAAQAYTEWDSKCAERVVERERTVNRLRPKHRRRAVRADCASAADGERICARIIAMSKAVG